MERDIERSTGADAAAPRRWGWRSNAAANLAIVTLCVLARPSQAQTPSPSLQVKIDSQWQMRAEQAWRVGDLKKAKALRAEAIEEAIASLFNGRTTLPLPGGYELILPEFSKLTVYTRTAILTAIEGRARNG